MTTASGGFCHTTSSQLTFYYDYPGWGEGSDDYC